MDFFKVVGAVASGLAEGVAGVAEEMGGVARAVVDVPVGMVKGVAEGVKEASSKMESVSTPGDGVSAAIGLLASPLTGAVSGGAKQIIKASGKVVQGVEKVLDD